MSLVIISVFYTEIWDIFHEKRGSAYSGGFGIKKTIAEFGGFTFFFFGQHSGGRSLTFRVAAYGQDRATGKEIRYSECVDSIGQLFKEFP